MLIRTNQSTDWSADRAFLEGPSMAEDNSRQRRSPENVPKSELNFTKY